MISKHMVENIVVIKEYFISLSHVVYMVEKMTFVNILFSN